MKSLLTDWDLVEKIIEEFLNNHMRTWESYDYFIIDDNTILIKVYDDAMRLMFTVKARLNNDKLQVVEVY